MLSPQNTFAERAVVYKNVSLSLLIFVTNMINLSKKMFNKSAHRKYPFSHNGMLKRNQTLKSISIQYKLVWKKLRHWALVNEPNTPLAPPVPCPLLLACSHVGVGWHDSCWIDGWGKAVGLHDHTQNCYAKTPPNVLQIIGKMAAT